MRRFKIAAVVISIISCAVVSCKAVNPEEDAIRRSIGRYNHALVLAYRDQNYGELKDIASEKEARKVTVIVESYLTGDEMMEAELLRLDFKGMEMQGDRATVRTSEDWNYRWINDRTGEDVEPLKGIHYEMLYHLTKKDGKWIVERLEETS